MTDFGATNGRRTLAQTLALVFGIVFLLTAILGFIPGITTNVDDMKFAGEDSPSELLGLFQVSILHNIAHGLFGIGILAARRHDHARLYLLASGIVYTLLFLYGLIVSEDSSANFVPLNNADDVLHLGLLIAFFAAYYVSGRERGVTDRAATV
ncbi:MAG: DUF4383 domain-containing protein [Thermoleophilia bacterium]|nr:DUF4383 domain-containing protein [Thermoleophilia bacterium]